MAAAGAVGGAVAGGITGGAEGAAKGLVVGGILGAAGGLAGAVGGVAALLATASGVAGLGSLGFLGKAYYHNPSEENGLVLVGALLGAAASGLTARGIGATNASLNRSSSITEGISNLIKSVRDGAINRINTLSASRRGPCYSGAYDPVTSKTFYGENFNMGSVAGRQSYKEFYDNAHPIVRGRIDARSEAIRNGSTNPGQRDGTPGAHAEVVALDKAIKAREAHTGRPTTEAELSEIHIHNRSTSNNRPAEPMDRCSNCEDITRGTTPVGHK